MKVLIADDDRLSRKVLAETVERMGHEGLEAGADDYVAKPFSPVEVHARIRAAERMLTYQAKLDHVIAHFDCGVLLSTSAGRVLLARLDGLPSEHAVGQLREEVLALHAVRAKDPKTFLTQMLGPDMQDVDLEIAGPEPRVFRWSSKMIDLPEGAARLDLCRDVTAQVQLARVLEEKAVRDHLTGLLNRRGGDEIIAREASRSTRFRTPLGFLLVDIDHFKKVNDVYGHAMGDIVLQRVAKCIAGQLRAYDHAIRWGGEEIMVVLPETSSFQATCVGERIRASIEALVIEGGPKVTVSCGIAELSSHGPNAKVCIEAADAALDRAKGAGRNCVKRAGDELVTLPPPPLLAKPVHSNPPP